MNEIFLSLMLMILTLLIIGIFLYKNRKKKDKLKSYIGRYNDLIEQKKEHALTFKEDELIFLRKKIRHGISLDKKTFAIQVKLFHPQMREFIQKFDANTRKDKKINVDDYLYIYDFLNSEI